MPGREISSPRDGMSIRFSGERAISQLQGKNAYQEDGCLQANFGHRGRDLHEEYFWVKAKQDKASQQHSDCPLRRGIWKKPRNRLGFGLQEKMHYGHGDGKSQNNDHGPWRPAKTSLNRTHVTFKGERAYRYVVDEIADARDGTPVSKERPTPPVMFFGDAISQTVSG
jgi:hypothetical protein